jgi:hypothetical protein
MEQLHDQEEAERDDEEEAPQYEGEVDSDGQQHGLGALHFPDGYLPPPS